jgi:NADH dehydrogenase
MRVVVIGGTGFVGSAIVDEMRKRGHDVVALSRRAGVDVNDPATLRGKLDRAGAVAHLVAIRRGSAADFDRTVAGARNVVAESKRAGVRRFLLMSANGADAASTPYFRAKLAMERAVKDAGFDWTIFRPSYVAAADEGGFDHEFARIVDRAPILPSFAGGKFEIQPIARSDVADAFANALDRPAAIGKTYVLVGRERFTWNEYLRKLARLRGRKRPIVHAPRFAVILLATVLGRLFPASADELRMLMEGSVGDPEPAARDLGLRLATWDEATKGLERRS